MIENFEANPGLSLTIKTAWQTSVESQNFRGFVVAGLFESKSGRFAPEDESNIRRLTDGLEFMAVHEIVKDDRLPKEIFSFVRRALLFTDKVKIGFVLTKTKLVDWNNWLFVKSKHEKLPESMRSTLNKVSLLPVIPL